MSDTSQGPGWWIASDGRWYPPELHPDQGVGLPEGWEGGPPGHRPPSGPSVAETRDELASWAPSAAGPMGAPAVDGQVPVAYGQLPGTASSGGRFSRGLRLVGTGFTMVRDEPGLMMVPVAAFVAQAIVLGLALLLIVPGLRTSDAADGTSRIHLSPAQWLVMVVAGVLMMFVSVVSHATIIARVMARFHGEQVTNATALRAALTRSPHLLAWAFINYVVISLLRNIGNRGIIGLLVGSLLRAGWYLASFFVVPVILFENRGAASAIKRSVALCKGRWGENVVGNGALGIIGFVAIALDVVVAAVLGMAFAPLGAVVGALGLVFILLVLTVASAAFNAALYWFAVTGQSPGQYSVGDLEAAYRQRSRRAGVYGV